MSVNEASRIFCFAFGVSYVLMVCRYPFMRYWKPLLKNTTVTCYLRHPENERQRSVNSFGTCIFRKQGIAGIFTCVTVLLTALHGNNTKYRRRNTDTKLLNIANYSTSKSTLLVAENTILIRYYKYTANSKASFESIDGSAGKPGDDPSYSDGLGVFHGTVPEWVVHVYWWTALSNLQWFGLDLDLDLKWWSGTVANIEHGTLRYGQSIYRYISKHMVMCLSGKNLIQYGGWFDQILKELRQLYWSVKHLKLVGLYSYHSASYSFRFLNHNPFYLS